MVGEVNEFGVGKSVPTGSIEVGTLIGTFIRDVGVGNDELNENVGNRIIGVLGAGVGLKPCTPHQQLCPHVWNHPH